MRGLLFFILALLACHGPLDVVVDQPDSPNHPAWIHDSKLSERTSVAADAAAVVWGGKPHDLNGWTVIYVPGPVEDLGATIITGNSTQDFMDTILGGGTIRIDDGYVNACLETTTLAHEVGHVVIGDGGHTDPRWRDHLFWSWMTSNLAQVVPLEDSLCRDFLLAGVIAGIVP